MITSLPIVTAQASLISLKPLELKSSSYFRETSVVFKNGINNETMLHACPLLNSIVFEAFNVTYAIWFLVSCLRVCLYWSIRVCGFRFMRWNSGFWYLCPYRLCSCCCRRCRNRQGGLWRHFTSYVSGYFSSSDVIQQNGKRYSHLFVLLESIFCRISHFFIWNLCKWKVFMSLL